MSTASTKKGREVLQPITNGPDMTNAPQVPMKPTDNRTASQQQQQPAVNKQSNPKKDLPKLPPRPTLVPSDPQRRASVSSFARPPPPPSSPTLRRTSIAVPNRPTQSPALLRPSLSSSLAKRARPSPSAKRVSFGSNTINFINQHKNEFTSPSAHSSNDSGSEGSSPDLPTQEQVEEASPRKALKTSALSSPSVPAATRSNLLSEEEEEQDDTVTIPDTSQYQTRPPPRADRPSTPVPIRRSSIARARQSFGIFLDDDITSEKEPCDRFNQDDDFGRSYHRISVGDDASPQSASPESDVTRDLTGISALMDNDESGMIGDNVGHHSNRTHDCPCPPTTEDFMPKLPSRRSPMNSRKSLAYVVDKELVFDTKREELQALTSRLSIAPIGAERRADRSTEESPQSSSPEDQTMDVGNILDRLECDEEEENAMNVELSSSSSQPAVPGIKPTARPILPENRKLFDVDVTDDTIHYYDAKDKNPISKMKSGEQHHPAPEEEQAHAPPVIPEEKSVSENAKNPSTSAKDLQQFVSPATHVSAVQNQAQAAPSTPRLKATAPSKSVTDACRPPTPHSETGFKIRAGLKEGVSVTRRSEADTQLQELSDSVLSASNAEVPVPKSNPAPKPKITLSEFLSTCNVRFDDTFQIDMREASLVAPVADDMDRSSMQARILESVKRKKILSRLQKELAKQSEIVNEFERRIKTLQDELEEKMPPAYAIVSKSDSMSSKEMSTFRISMKRLRKVAALRVRLDWVQSRQIWEGAIRGEVEQVLKEGEKYVTELVSSEGSYGKQSKKFKDVLRSKGVQLEAGDAEDSAAVAALRRDVNAEFSYVNDLKNLILSKKKIETEMLQKRGNLVGKTADVFETVKKLRVYAGAMVNNNLQGKVTELAELNMLISRIAGFQPRSISPMGISATIVDLLDMKLKFDGDIVTDVVLSVSSSVDSLQPVMQSFVDGAVSACRHAMQGLVKVRDVPFALYVCRERMSFMKSFLSSLTRYSDRHIGELAATHLDESDDSSNLEVTFVSSFYSLSKWTKFDVTVTVSTVVPKQCTGSPFQKLQFGGVTRFIGTTPTAETIESTIQDAGFRRNGQIFNTVDAFAAVWQLLEPCHQGGSVPSLNY